MSTVRSSMLELNSDPDWLIIGCNGCVTKVNAQCHNNGVTHGFRVSYARAWRHLLNIIRFITLTLTPATLGAGLFTPRVVFAKSHLVTSGMRPLFYDIVTE